MKHPDFLTFNYRSSQHIITAANCVIGSQPCRLKDMHPITINPERQQQANGGIWAERDPERQGRVRIIRLPSAGTRQQKNNRQTQAVIQEIGRLKNLGAKISEMAVLAAENATLKPVQAWCEQNKIPYFLKKNSMIRPVNLRSFVRLVDGLDKQEKQGNTKLNARAFSRLIHEQQTDETWQQYFAQMSSDFMQQHAMMPSETHTVSDGITPEYPVSYLKSWLYDYTGELENLRKQGLFIGTVHSAKGLEFKHVFILDDHWDEAGDEQRRLFYVGMTRAAETLTLIHESPQHAWLPLMPSDTETVMQDFPTDTRLNTEYRTLEPGELDIGFAGRDSTQPAHINNIKCRLKTIAEMQTGDLLTLRPCSRGYEFLASDGTVVGIMSKKGKQQLTNLPSDTRVIAAEFYVRYRNQTDAEYLAAYPAEVSKWTVVVPQLMLEQPD